MNKKPLAQKSENQKSELEELTYEQAREELAQVVSNLERGGLDLEAAIVLWERGESLIGYCREKLQRASQRIDNILHNETDNSRFNTENTDVDFVISE